MPTGVFTPSASRKLLQEVTQRFTRPTMIEAEFSHPVMTAKLLLERNTASWEPRIMNGNICQGVDIWFLQSGADTVTSSGTAPGALTCTSPAGIEAQTNNVSYNNNIAIEATVTINDKKCDNELQFIDESRKQIQKAITDIHRRLNAEFAIPLLTNNVQPNQYAGAANYSLLSQGTGNRLKLDPALWNFESLQAMKLLANNNDIYEYFVLDSSNLWLDRALAEIRNQNRAGQTGQDELASFNQFDIHWDTRDMETALTRRSTFIVNPNVIGFWNVTWSSPFNSPTMEDSSQNLWTYTMPDPILRWNDNGTLRPVMYEVEYSYECLNRSSVGQRQYAHKYFIRLYGGLVIAPPGMTKPPIGSATAPAAELTGIMEIVNEGGAAVP